MIRATYWSWSVSVVRDDGGRHEGLVISSTPTFITAMEEGIRDGLYYLGVGYKEVDITLTELCARCDGVGQILVKRRKLDKWGVRKPCPDCKNKPEVNRVGPIRVLPHPNIQIARGA